MTASSHERSAVTVLRGPNTMPAVAPAPLTGERYITSTLLTRLFPHTGPPGPISSLTRAILPPLVGAPSVASHWRSTTASGTPVLLQVKVAPWSSEREVLKFASVRSAK